MVLPAPEGPTNATVCPAATAKADVLQHRPGLVVGERHVLERDVAAHARQLDGVGALLAAFDRHVEIIEDALEHRERADDLHLHAGERRGRGVEPAEIGDEGDDRSDGQAAMDGEPGAAEPHQRRPDDHHRVDRADEPAADHRQADFEVHEAGRGVVEARLLERLAHERLHQDDAGDRERLLREALDLVAPLARLLADRRTCGGRSARAAGSSSGTTTSASSARRQSRMKIVTIVVTIDGDVGHDRDEACR